MGFEKLDSDTAQAMYYSVEKRLTALLYQTQMLLEQAGILCDRLANLATTMKVTNQLGIADNTSTRNIDLED